MDELRAYLLSERNFQMLEKLVISKVKQLTSLIVEADDPSFSQQLMLITSTVISSELRLNPKVDNSTVLRINSIIIAEASKYISNLLLVQSSSSKIEELYESEEEPEIEPVLLRQAEPENPVTFKTEILSFDKPVTEVNLKNVISIELVNCYFDFSDYVLTENNNSFYLDNEPVTIKIGNYTPSQLINNVNDLVSAKVLFEIDPFTENIIISQHKSKKSMTGSIKDNQKQVNLDFGVKNSIAKLLGFSEKTYIIKEQTLVSEFKHNIKHPSVVKFSVSFDNSCKLEYSVPTNVKYNETIHYKPNFSNVIKTQNIDINFVTINLEYNTRGRPFSFDVKFNSVV
jgi:hypothetical protein